MIGPVFIGRPKRACQCTFPASDQTRGLCSSRSSLPSALLSASIWHFPVVPPVQTLALLLIVGYFPSFHWYVSARWGINSGGSSWEIYDRLCFVFVLSFPDTGWLPFRSTTFCDRARRDQRMHPDDRNAFRSPSPCCLVPALFLGF